MKSIFSSLKSFFRLLPETYKVWNENEPFQMSAAVSYYALFSFPALLIIIIRVVGIFYESAMVKSKILKEISTMLGTDAAKSIDSMLHNAAINSDSKLFLIIGVVTLLYGASGLFISLQKSLNTIWNVETSTKNTYLKLVVDRLFSLGLVIIIGFLLLISLVITTIITVMTDWIQVHFPDLVVYLVQFINLIVSFSITTVLFAMIFKILPDISLKWKHVWLGAFVTTVFFTIGKTALGIYFGEANPASAYGTAGSVILILLWVSYSSLILFFGAAFTKVYANKFSKKAI